MEEQRIHLDLTHGHEKADKLNESDPKDRFDDTKWSGCYELHIIKRGADQIGFCVIALNGRPEVAKFFICPLFRKSGFAVAAAHSVFSYIERTHGTIYSLQVRQNNDRAWSFWSKAVVGRKATQSGSNILIGDWE